MSGGETSDDGVAGPAQRGDAEQEVGLAGDPVARSRRTRGLVGGGHFRIQLGNIGSGGFNTPWSVRVVWSRNGFMPARFTDTDFSQGSMGRDASRPCVKARFRPSVEMIEPRDAGGSVLPDCALPGTVFGQPG